MQKVAASVGKKAFASKAQQYQSEDPLYENYTDQRGRSKKRRRAIPEGLSKRDADVLRKVRKRAHYLDKGISLCGFRVGYTFFIGLIPGLGDAVDLLLAYKLVIGPSTKCDLPPLMRERMVANALIAAGLGIIPLVGDVALAAYRPNSRNAHLLEKFLVERAAKNLGQPGQPQDEQAAASNVISQVRKWGFSSKTGAPNEPSTTAPSTSTSVTIPPSTTQYGTVTNNTNTPIPAISEDRFRQYIVAEGSLSKCQLCSKTFQNDTFTMKHLANKHAESF